MPKNEDIEIKFSSDFLKKNWKYIVLIAILLLGFYLRVYHVDYPVVGYHNWKETHYLTEARNFAEGGYFEHGFFIPSTDFPHIRDAYSDPAGAHSDPFPVISILISLFFFVFGPSLLVARLVNIFLGVGIILLMYLVLKRLFRREDLALVGALVTAINPLFVFFNRQVQDINSAMFFGLLSILMYLIWYKDRRTKYLILTALFMGISFMNKYSFALLAVPIFFTFPFSKLKNKNTLKHTILSALFFVIPVLFWFFYSKVKSIELNTKVAATQFKLSTLASPAFWQSLQSYIADNYTFLGIFFAFLGLVFFILFYKKRFEYRFFLWYIIGIIPWIIVMSDKLSGHNYHQYPLVPLFVFLVAYSFLIISVNIAKILKIRKLKWLILIVLFTILFMPSMDSKDRMFDTQFRGLDVAGEYIKENSEENERILFPGHQSYGVLWHADRKGFAGIPSEEDIIYAETERNVTWIFLYQWGLDTTNQPQWDYISGNYHLEQVAFELKGENQPSLVYLLLKKGGSFNMSSLNNLALNQETTQARNYEFSGGEFPLYFSSIT